jgi:hypothetical protein
MLQCRSSALYVTNGALGSDACVVTEVVPGTAPLSGHFRLALDTKNHTVINIQALDTTRVIAHNAPVPATESGGDGTSVQERLQELTNVGEVSVARSAVDPLNGGYTWTVTFLRDKASTGSAVGRRLCAARQLL